MLLVKQTIRFSEAANIEASFFDLLFLNKLCLLLSCCG